MMRNWKILVISGLGLVVILRYFFSNVNLVELFFSIPLATSTAYIHELLEFHYALKSNVVRTLTTVDAKGRIYIAGKKNHKIQVIVLNPEGKVERTIFLLSKDGSHLKYCCALSASPSGNYIWTLSEEGKDWAHRVIVHDLKGKAVAEWLERGISCSHWILNAYSDFEAYGMDAYYVCRYYIVNQKQPQQFKLPIKFFPLFYHNGRYWGIEEIKGKGPYKWYGAFSWSSHEGTRLVTKFRTLNFKPYNLQWIDDQGNFYLLGVLNPRLYPLEPLLDKIIKLCRVFGIHLSLTLNHSEKPLTDARGVAIQIFSHQGKVIDTIIWPGGRVEDNQLKYGNQIIKVDEKGIYLEVERIVEPREYQIVRIMKKPRWKVWLEGLVK